MPRFPTSCFLLPTSRPRFIFYFPARFDELPSAEKRGKWSSLWFGNCRCLVSIVFLDDFDDADGDDDYVVDMDDVVPAFFFRGTHTVAISLIENVIAVIDIFTDFGNGSDLR